MHQTHTLRYPPHFPSVMHTLSPLANLEQGTHTGDKSVLCCLVYGMGSITRRARVLCNCQALYRLETTDASRPYSTFAIGVI